MPQSLAQFLSLPDSPGAPAPARPSGPRMSRRDFARGILDSDEYRQSIFDRIRLGTLPPAVETLLYYYADGKPTEKLEIDDRTERNLEAMPVERLEERALMLADIARRLRAREEAAARGGADDDGPAESGRVH